MRLALQQRSGRIGETDGLEGGGGSPLGCRDGKEIFDLSKDGRAKAVDINTSGVFQAGMPKA